MDAISNSSEAQPHGKRQARSFSTNAWKYSVRLETYVINLQSSPMRLLSRTPTAGTNRLNKTPLSTSQLGRNVNVGHEPRSFHDCHNRSYDELCMTSTEPHVPYGTGTARWIFPKRGCKMIRHTGTQSCNENTTRSVLERYSKYPQYIMPATRGQTV